jgi:hypothetical protein
MTQKKTSQLTALFFLLILSASGTISLTADPFNKNLNSTDRAKLMRGEVVIRNVNSLKELSIKKTNETDKMLSVITDLKPAYIAEIIQVRPYKGNEDLDKKTEAILANIPGYAGIPYYSEQAEKWYELYSSAAITGIKNSGTTKTITADLEMSVFGTVNTLITIERTNDTLFYTMKNVNRLRYHGEFTAIEPQKMQSVIVVYRDGDNWILYAIGGVDTYKIFFLKDRVETSFMNRIKTFCNFVFTKLDEKEGSSL